MPLCRNSNFDGNRIHSHCRNPLFHRNNFLLLFLFYFPYVLLMIVSNRKVVLVAS